MIHINILVIYIYVAMYVVTARVVTSNEEMDEEGHYKIRTNVKTRYTARFRTCKSAENFVKLQQQTEKNTPGEFLDYRITKRTIIIPETINE